MTDDKLITRIQKLLALASNNPNENEAAAAAEKAQTLMTEHNISIMMIAEASGENDIVGINHTTIDENTRAGWKITLADSVARSMGGKVVYTPWSRWNEGNIQFFGPTDAVPVMVDVYRYLKLQLDLLSAEALAAYKADPSDVEWDGTKIHGKTYRNSWMMGAVSRLNKRLREAYNRQVQDAGATSALVVLNNRVDDYIEQEVGRTRKTSRNTNYNGKAYRAGHGAAGSMSLGQKNVGGGRTQLHA